MAIEKDEHGNVTLTGDGIGIFHLLQIKGVLRLELKGIKVWNRSAMFSLADMGMIPAKRQYTKADREATLKALTEYLDSIKPNQKNNAE